MSADSATMGTLTLGVLLTLLPPVGGAHVLCDLLGVMIKEREMCADSLAHINVSAAIWWPEGCSGMWDNLSCWPPTPAGHTISIPCPEVLQLITGVNGTVTRNCTESGWSATFPPVDIACQYNINDTEYEDVQEYYMHLKTLYTVGYGTSLSSLLLALLLLLSFRRLRCTRNYIHINLFSSFILRALSIFIKDAVLFSIDDINHCKVYRKDCHYVMIFFQYCIMANYSWLLVEGLYLHTLLVVSFFSEWKYFCWYIALGWGSPLVFIIAWSVCRQLYENMGCWNINSNASVWWIIRGPVVLSIFINFILFVRIIRILMKKLRTSDVWGNDFNQYKRLARSTLLLIPLFGVHYIIFAFFPEDVSSGTVEIRLSFELALGSFQGFVVAVLYCFLNGEVQFEIQRKWRRYHLRKYFWLRQNKHSTVSNGGSVLTQVVQLSRGSQREARKSSTPMTSLI
ncbi:secretin receptor isoform 2-T2 [Anomaloglossus baeobatrachus]|uniref:secretin receptor isoform X1 n=1 Tax=Anomaloglossus baeobatrachus TaxID=238106 RepID=UPI003F4F9690